MYIEEPYYYSLSARSVISKCSAPYSIVQPVAVFAAKMFLDLSPSSLNSFSK